MSKFKYIVIPVLLFIAAFLLRLYKLDQVTPGFLSDEIPIAKSAEQVVSSPYSPFYIDHPTFPLYIIGFFLRLFGRSLIALRLSPVLFASLTLPVFYLLCRRFFSLPVSLASSLLLNFSYSHIITSRFANEVSPAVFFQTLSYLFLILAVQKKSLPFLLALSVSLGLGLNTYLTFYSQAVMISAIALLFYPHKKHFLAFFPLLILVVSPLFFFTLGHPNRVFSRARQISVFHQKLPPSDVVREILASSKNIIRGFFIHGDPDPRQNPARAALYDPATTTLALLGLAALFRRSRRLFFATLFLGLPVFLNDALTIEIIPNFRIPGQAHPNTFHLSGFIPLVYLSVAFGLNSLRSLHLHPHLLTPLVSSLILLISLYNLDIYFHQPLEPYVYYFHNVRNRQITSALNKFSSTIYVSPSLIDHRITYFLKSSPTLIPLSDVATPPAFIDLRAQPNLVPATPSAIIYNPWGNPEIAILNPP